MRVSSRRIATVLLLLAMLYGLSGAAYADDCTAWVQVCAGDTWFPAGIRCPNDGVPRVCNNCWVNVCAVDGPSETAPGCPECEKGQATAGGPISLATGNTYIRQTDLTLPGLGGGLTLVRTWNSKWPTTQSAFRLGRFGVNWRSNFEERVFVGSDGTVKYSRDDGSFWSFGWSGDRNWNVVSPANGGATLTQETNYWTLTYKNGEQRRFDIRSGWLIAIIDRNGNTTQLSYDTLNRLVTITDPASRHLYFGYADDTSTLVTSVSSDVGIALSYSYNGDSTVAKVTKPDNTALSFEYSAPVVCGPPACSTATEVVPPLITAVKDAEGKILESHTYDNAGRGLTSSRAGSVESISVTYSDSIPKN